MVPQVQHQSLVFLNADLVRFGQELFEINVDTVGLLFQKGSVSGTIPTEHALQRHDGKQPGQEYGGWCWRDILGTLGFFKKQSGRTQWVKDGEGRFSHEWRFWFSWFKIVSFCLQKCDLAFWVFHWVKGLAWRWHPTGYTMEKGQWNSWIP